MAGSNDWAAIGAKAATRVALAVQLTSVAVVQRATVNTTRIDTSDMKNGWESAMRGVYEARITNSQNYTIFHEYGTARFGAAPMLTPALEAARAPFEKMLAQAIR